MANKITWVNFLHIYQPPWQDRGVVEQVAIESYEYLLTLFEKYPNFKASLNITGDLVEQFEEIRPDLLKRLQAIVKKGQIELTSSAKFHALLPLIPKAEIKRQLELNQVTLAQYFDIKKIKGFYMPEMAYSSEAAKVVKSFGFKWLILDEMHAKEMIDPGQMYVDQGSGLKVAFRNREISKGYPAEIIFHKLKNNEARQTIVTATDGEVYGHFHEDWQGHVEKVLQNNNLIVKTVSQYLAKSAKPKKIALRAATWETKEADLKKRIPYSLWDAPKNKIHKKLWQLVSLTIDLVGKYKKDKNWHWARNHLDQGLSSCTFWWASATKPSDFSPLTWNPDMIDNGSEQLIKAVRSLDKASNQEKIKAEKIYISIKKETWLTHWRKYNK